MPPPLDSSSIITDGLIADACDYWRRIRGERSMPRRADLDPNEIKPILPHVMLVDVLGPGRYRYRLIGTRCVDAHGFNASGRTFEEALKDVAYRSHIIGLYDQCVDERRPVYSESIFFDERESDIERRVKALLMPLSDDGTAVNMVLVVQVIQFANDSLWGQHFTTIRPHKEICRAVLCLRPLHSET